MFILQVQFSEIDDLLNRIEGKKGPGVPHQKKEEERKLFPNPAKDQVTFAFENSKERTVLISNIQGQTMMNQTITGSNATLNTSDLSNGVYIVVISEANKISSTKLIINR